MWHIGVVLAVCVLVCSTEMTDNENSQELASQSQVYDDETLDGNSLEIIDKDYDNPWSSKEDNRNIAMTKRFMTLFRNRAPKSEGYKRGPGFRSWGGKRASQPETINNIRKLLNWEVKRKFSSWGGKRAQDDFLFQKKLYSKKKPTFHSWGGKRLDQYVS